MFLIWADIGVIVQSYEPDWNNHLSHKGSYHQVPAATELEPGTSCYYLSMYILVIRYVNRNGVWKRLGVCQGRSPFSAHFRVHYFSSLKRPSRPSEHLTKIFTNIWTCLWFWFIITVTLSQAENSSGNVHRRLALSTDLKICNPLLSQTG